MHKIRNAILTYKDDFIFNSLEIKNFNSLSSRLRYWFHHLEKNLENLDGDIFEFGVFRGASLNGFFAKKV